MTSRPSPNDLPEHLRPLAERLGRMPAPFPYDDGLNAEIMAQVRTIHLKAEPTGLALGWTTLGLGLFFTSITASIMLGAALSPALDRATVLNLTLILSPALPAGVASSLLGISLVRGVLTPPNLPPRAIPPLAMFAAVLAMGLTSPVLGPLASIAVAMGLAGVIGWGILALASTFHPSKDLRHVHANLAL
ncbi:MAG: hypothetical protein EOM25_12910 [Deltaproteobacteria bacterium]|nr:hypothetical protein [Deltaproteobacteria bacterium]